MYAVLLSQFLHGHGELTLRVTLRPHVEVDGTEETATFAHAEVLHMPIRPLLVGRIDLRRRGALVRTEPEVTLVSYCVARFGTYADNDVKTIVRLVVDML